MIKKTILSLVLVVSLGFAASYEDGRNALKKEDYKKAFTIFEDLANQGDEFAQVQLGAMYLFGQGVEQDKKKAKELLHKSCIGGVKTGCDYYKILDEQGY